MSNSKGKFYYVTADLTKEVEIVKSFKWAKENLGPIHILINNAGVGGEGFPGPIMGGNFNIWKSIMETNVLALSTATREAIADMNEFKTDGHIVNISSLAGHQVFPVLNMSLYTASKHAVKALTEAVRLELVNVQSKIKITVSF